MNKTYNREDILKIQDIGVGSANFLFDSTPNDTFYLTSIYINEIRMRNKKINLSVSFYEKRDMDEDISIIKRLIKRYENNLPVNPIVVDENNNIMDGIHRYVAQKELNFNKIKVFKRIPINKKILKENEEDLNPIFQPSPNQLERYKQELERKKKKEEENFQKLKLGLKKINKAFENKQWKSEEEKLFLESFYKSEIKMDFEKYPKIILIKKNSKYIAYQDLKYEVFRIDYLSIWKVFENKFRWKYYEIQSFMEIMLNKYFKLKDYIFSTKGTKWLKLLNNTSN